MTDSAVGSESRKSNFQISPERMAWSILLGSFAIFCLSCAVITFGVHFFFFRSTTSLQTTLQVARGIPAGVGGVDRALGGIYPLSSGSSIRTDTTDRFSQSSVYFRDTGSEQNTLIAVITMKSDSALTVRSATRPRFDWGSANYVIDVYNVSGQFDVLIANDLGRGIEFNIWTTNETLIKLSASGHYSFTASDTIRLTNWDGEALLVAPGLVANRSIPRGQQASLRSGETEITLDAARINLIQNNYLRASSASTLEAGDPNPPDRWSCANGPNNMPRGRYGFETSPDGRRALRFVRGDQTTTTPGSTFCTQPIGSETSAGVDVSEFDQLEFRATVYIASQSLSGCGFEGSECPLMMQIDYIREDGQASVWYHGVYARRPGPNENYPLNCASCLREHVLIYEDAWYTYESGNLFDIYQLPGTRPRRITGVTFYASGHHYDVYVSEVDLLVSDVINGQNGAEDASEG